MSLSTLLFDLDGTLTDPAPGFLASIHYALDTLNRKAPPDAELVRYIGPPLRNTMSTLLGTDDRVLIEKAVELYRWRLENGGKFEAEVIEGIPDVLRHFVDTGHPLYVCTGKPVGFAREIVNYFDLDRYFRNVYGADLDGQHANKGDLIRHIWAVEKIMAPDGIMVGDTVYDIAGAKENQLSSIGVRWGYGEEQDLQKAGADEMVTTPRDLIPAVERLC